jgi:THO complex subunit 2
MELGILGSLLKIAGGYGFADYSPAASLSSTQLEGRAGSFTLKRETMSFGIVEVVNPHTTEIIKRVLQKDGFGVSMLILIAQARSRLIFQSSKGASKAVKLVGNLYDACQVVISILLEFLTTEEPQEKENEMESSTAIEEYAKRLPALDDLHFKFGLDIESSWMLARPLIRSVVQKKESQEAPDPTLVVTQTYSFRKKYESMLPEDAWSHLSPSLFESFYTNSLYDIFCPEEVYASELNRVGKEVERLDRAKAGGPTGVQVGANPPKNEAVELTRLNKVINFLTSDKDHQKQHVANVQEELDEKKHDFMNSDVVSQEAAKSFLLYCVYPRSLQTPDDAMYCAHFAFQLHGLETPGFSTLHYIDELISVASGALFGLTEAEAANLAILLWQTWARVNKWRYEEGLYETEVAGKPGSYMQQDGQGADGENEAPQEVSHKEFVGLYNSWHSSLGKALLGCLTSSEYMHMRTGLVILTRLVEVFPTRPGLGNKLLSTLKPLQDENSDRPDIRASANAYCTMLLRARDDGKWVEEDAAVAQARADQEKAAARERKRKLEEQFEELQRDSEKITEEIGPRDDFERRRDQRGGFGGPRAAAPPASDRARGATSQGRETGEVTGGDTRDNQDRRSPPRDTDRRRERDSDRGNERGNTSTSSARVGDRQVSDRNRRDGGGGDRAVRTEDRGGTRWARGETVPPTESARTSSSRAPKRGRGPSPEDGMDDRGSTKRTRIEPESNNETRRDAGRDASPPRRARSGAESSRTSRTRRTRR